MPGVHGTQPCHIRSQTTISINHGEGIIPHAIAPHRILGQKCADKPAAKPRIERIDDRGERSPPPGNPDNGAHHGAVFIDRPDADHPVAGGVLERRLHENQRPAPDRHRHAHPRAGKSTDKAIAQRAAGDGVIGDNRLGKRRRRGHNRCVEQNPIVRDAKMLLIKRIDADHVPRRLDHQVKRLGRQQFIWRFAGEKLHWIARNGRIAEKDVSAKLSRWKDRLACQRGNRAACGNVPARAVGGVLPCVKRATQRAARHATS